MLLLLLRLLLTIGVAALAGKLISKIKLPSILGWLITGMVLGPHALSLMSQEILDAAWYQTIVHVLECGVGLMIGTELVWNKIKRSGKAIVITTLTQSLGTFAVVSLVFGIVFFFAGIPLYLAFIFGGIALATAPAPALSIVRELARSPRPWSPWRRWMTLWAASSFLSPSRPWPAAFPPGRCPPT